MEITKIGLFGIILNILSWVLIGVYFYRNEKYLINLTETLDIYSKLINQIEKDGENEKRNIG